MIKAASYLEDELAWFVVVEKLYGFEVPEAVDTASQALSDLVEYLEGMLQSPRKGGPDPDNRRQLCAAVCGYIWQRQHGKLQPYWSPLQEACEAYWHACGQVETGDAKNWEEFLDLARKEDAWELFAKHPLTPR